MPFSRRFSGFWIAATVLAAGGCSSPSVGDAGRNDATSDLGGDGTPSDGSQGDGTVGDANTLALRVEPPTAELVANVSDPSAAMQSFRVFFQPGGGSPEVDVTAEAMLVLSDATFATVRGNAVANPQRGGTVRVTARARGTMGTAMLHVRMTGDVVTAGADPGLPARFTAGTDDPTAASAPAVEYPLANAVVPSNVPPMELQWTQAADNDAYRVALRAGSDLDVSFYTPSRELMVDLAQWQRAVGSARGAQLSVTVYGINAAGQRRASAPVAFNVATDKIDASSIYYWESSSGTFRVLDFAASTNLPLPTDSTAVAAATQGGTCVACHSVARNGRRYAYTTGNFNYGTLRLAADDAGAPLYSSVIEPGAAPTLNMRASHGAFNPLEDTTRAALLLTTGDVVAANTQGHVRLQLIDPDTGAEVPSDLAAMIASLPDSVGHDVLIPDWSDDGGSVVFSAYDSEAMGLTAATDGSGTEVPTHAYVRILTDDAVSAAIVEARVRYDAAAGMFHFDNPRVLVPAGTDPSFDRRENNVLPVFSPDATLVAFTRADGWWPIRYQSDPVSDSGRLAIVRRADGATVELSTASGPPHTNTTWAQWAPTTGERYAWLAFSSSRPYGHRMAPGVPLASNCIPQGRTLCKQMWITAIDLRAAGATPLLDPSAVPFWIPGQNYRASAVSPRWTVQAIPPG